MTRTASRRPVRTQYAKRGSGSSKRLSRKSQGLVEAGARTGGAVPRSEPTDQQAELPTITGPESYNREQVIGPSFAVDAGKGRFWAVEVAADIALFSEK